MRIPLRIDRLRGTYASDSTEINLSFLWQDKKNQKPYVCKSENLAYVSLEGMVPLHVICAALLPPENTHRGPHSKKSSLQGNLTQMKITQD